MAADAAWCAVGLLTDRRAIGFVPSDGGYLVGISDRDRPPRTAEAEPAVFVALALAWFTEALPPDPGDLAAAQDDLAALVGWLRDSVTDDGQRRALLLAADAIDDGQAGDVVAGHLFGALEAPAGSDPLDVIRGFARRSGWL
jgi:hypothetical protein